MSGPRWLAAFVPCAVALACVLWLVTGRGGDEGPVAGSPGGAAHDASSIHVDSGSEPSSESGPVFPSLRGEGGVEVRGQGRLVRVCVRSAAGRLAGALVYATGTSGGRVLGHTDSKGCADVNVDDAVDAGVSAEADGWLHAGHPADVRGLEEIEIYMSRACIVRVSVRAPDGRPERGATVGASWQPSGDDAFPPITAPRDGRLVSDASGNAELVVPAGYRLELVGHGEDGSWASVSFTPCEAQDSGGGQEIELTLQPPARRAITVVAWSGEPAAGADVLATAGPVWMSSTQLDSSGTGVVRLPPSSVPGGGEDAVLEIRASGVAPHAVHVADLGEPGPEGWRIVLPPPGTLQGIVQDARGQGIAHLSIVARSVDAAWMRLPNAPTVRTNSDSGGRFELRGLPAGAIGVEAYGEDLDLPLARAWVPRAQHGAAYDGSVVLRLPELGEFEVRVASASGGAIARARVDLLVRSATAPWISSASAQAVGGVARFEGLPESDILVKVSGQGVLPQFVRHRFHPANREPLHVVVPAAAINGSIRGTDGRPLRLSVLIARLPSDRDTLRVDTSVEIEADAEGRFECLGVDGACTMHLRTPGFTLLDAHRWDSVTAGVVEMVAFPEGGANHLRFIADFDDASGLRIDAAEVLLLDGDAIVPWARETPPGTGWVSAPMSRPPEALCVRLPGRPGRLLRPPPGAWSGGRARLVVPDDESKRIAGHVVGEGEEPVQGATIASGVAFARTADDGSFELELECGLGSVLTLEGQFIIGRIEYALRDGALEPIVIRVPHGGCLGVVVDRAAAIGDAPSAVWVRRRGASAAEWTTELTMPASRGAVGPQSAQFLGLRAGTYEVQVLWKGYLRDAGTVDVVAGSWSRLVIP